MLENQKSWAAEDMSGLRARAKSFGNCELCLCTERPCERTDRRPLAGRLAAKTRRNLNRSHFILHAVTEVIKLFFSHASFNRSRHVPSIRLTPMFHPHLISIRPSTASMNFRSVLAVNRLCFVMLVVGDSLIVFVFSFTWLDLCLSTMLFE